jgi:hypothetical protein
MTHTAAPETQTYHSQAASPNVWSEVERLIDLECRRLKKSRHSPRLTLGAQIWVEEHVLPKEPRVERRLELILRRSFQKHQITLCEQDVHVGLFKKGELKHGLLEVVPYWGVAVPERDFEELAKAARSLAEKSLNFAERAQSVPKGRSP